MGQNRKDVVISLYKDITGNDITNYHKDVQSLIYNFIRRVYKLDALKDELIYIERDSCNHNITSRYGRNYITFGEIDAVENNRIYLEDGWYFTCNDIDYTNMLDFIKEHKEYIKVEQTIEIPSDLPNIRWMFGVEIEGYIEGYDDWDEVSCYLKDLLYSAGIDVVINSSMTTTTKWKITSDGSLSEGGFELVSPPMKDLHDLYKVMYVLNDNGFYVDDTCGLHIHCDAFNKSGDKILNIYNLSKLVALAEPFIYERVVKNEYRVERYCMPMTKTFKDGIRLNLQTAYNLYKAGVLDDYMKCIYYNCYNPDITKYNGARYRGLNLNSYWYRGTVEFRYFDATTDFYKMAEYIKLVTNLMHYVVNYYSSNDTFAKFMRTYDINKELLIA